MAFGFPSFRFFTFILAVSFLFQSAKSDDASNTLLLGINKYRASLNLSALTKNSNAECFADQIALQFKDQPCTNTTGSNTVPGTEPQFLNYPNFLDHCHLNASVTRDGVILPACVLGLDPSLVLTNFTMSQYSQNLNSSDYVGAGIASEGNWIVLVLTTNTSTGDFATFMGTSSAARFSFWYPLASVVVGSFMALYQLERSSLIQSL